MKKILVIDNYDSFTYNLVQYLLELGTQVTVWQNNRFSIDDVRDLRPSGILISPGPCSPNEAGLSLEVISTFAGIFPILGVCLGHQSIGQAFGAKVVRAYRPMHGKTSTIRHNNTGLFAGLPNNFIANRYHSLVVKDLSEDLCVNAWVDEFEQETVMGIYHVRHPVHGVQFHPESALTQYGYALLKNFLEIL
jgi:anthranilate synthase component II